ncbi:MAG: hypothetical protein KDA60_13785 [Planctomycetales bacterium]|nr:hypothetical protein [Planctomycetales bacterium]
MSEAVLDPTRSHLFWCSQSVLVGLVIAGSVWSSQSIERGPRLPVFNDQPRTVRPTYDDVRVVSDAQLDTVLTKVRPSFAERPTKVNYIDHAIRLWGPRVAFPDDSLSGRQMLAMLLDHQTFTATWGSQVPPLLQRSSNGVDVMTQQGKSTVSHVDHLMGTLAELGLPLSQPIRTAEGKARVGDILHHALVTFRLNQREYEWTTLAAAMYAVDGSAWVTREGQQIDFDALARRIMRQAQPEGVCYGQHRLYTLTMLLRIDDQMQTESPARLLLSESARQDVHAYLVGMTRQFFQSQSAEGYWDGNWADTSREVPDPQTDPVSRRILATGHVLEWWAMAPVDLHPPRETIVRGAQWLARTIGEMDARDIESNYTFLTHAARSLALWRGGFAEDFVHADTSASAPQVDDVSALVPSTKH